MSSLLGKLPEEIVENIISLLFIPNSTHSAAKSSTSVQWSPLTVLYTSRLLNRIATPFLYAHVKLHHSAQPELLARTLNAQPHLLVKIRTLVVDAPFSGLGVLASVVAKARTRRVTSGLRLDVLDITLDIDRNVNVFTDSRPSSPHALASLSSSSNHTRSYSFSQASSSSTIPPLADVTVGLVALLAQITSVNHLTIRKHGYLTNPGTRRVLEGLADIIKNWREMETVDFKFAPAPLPITMNTSVILPSPATGPSTVTATRSRGRSLGANSATMRVSSGSGFGEESRHSRTSFQATSLGASQSSTVSSTNVQNFNTNPDPYALAHTLSRLPNLRAIRAVRPSVWNDFLRIVSENQRLERVVLVQPGDDFECVRDRAEREWIRNDDADSGLTNASVKGKAKERTPPSPPYPRRASESTFSSTPYNYSISSSIPSWNGPSSWSSTLSPTSSSLTPSYHHLSSTNNTSHSAYHQFDDSILDLPAGNDLYTSHAATHHPRLYMLIMEGRRWRWRINSSQAVQDRQRIGSSNGGHDKWRTRAHTYSNNSATTSSMSSQSTHLPIQSTSNVTVASSSPRTAFPAKPSTSHSQTYTHSSSSASSRTMHPTTPPRTRTSQSRGTVSPPPSSFSYPHLSTSMNLTSAYPNHQSRTLAYASGNGYQTLRLQ